MRLDKEGEPATIAGLLAAFGNRPWFEGELTHFEDVDALEQVEPAGAVRLYPAGLTTDEPIDTDGGPFVVVVDGDLVTPDSIRFSTDDYIPGLIVVTGNVRASALAFELGARVIIEGSAVLKHACLGRWGDANAMLDVEGELETPVLVLDGSTPVYSPRGIKSVICDGLGWWEPLRPDILPRVEKDYFLPDVLDDGSVDFELAFAAARQGSPLLRPGVAESFPQRLVARPATPA